MVFLEAMAGASPQDRFTDSQLYNIFVPRTPSLQLCPAAQQSKRRESSQPCSSHWNTWSSQPRRSATSRSSPGWLLIQNWATLRFSDHRLILPSSVKIDETGFSAQLARLKTLGSDRTVASRPLVIDRCCFLAVAGRMQEGWRFLTDVADYPRDYLIPFPSSNGHGCGRRELSYDTASAMQNRVLRMVRLGDEPLFCAFRHTVLNSALQLYFHAQRNRDPGV